MPRELGDDAVRARRYGRKLRARDTEALERIAFDLRLHRALLDCLRSSPGTQTAEKMALLEDRMRQLRAERAQLLAGGSVAQQLVIGLAPRKRQRNSLVPVILAHLRALAAGATTPPVALRALAAQMGHDTKTVWKAVRWLTAHGVLVREVAAAGRRGACYRVLRALRDDE